MDNVFEFDEDLTDFFPNKSNTPLYELFDYETVTALLKVSTVNGCYFVTTKIDMFFNEEDELDEDLFELKEDEPVYIWNGKKELEKTDLKIHRVYEVLDWRLEV